MSINNTINIHIKYGYIIIRLNHTQYSSHVNENYSKKTKQKTKKIIKNLVV